MKPFSYLTLSPLALVAFSASVHAVSFEAPTPFFQSATCATDNTGENPQCGFVEVPENRKKPNGPKVKLAVMKFTRHDLTSQEEPIVFLHGEGAGSLSFDGVKGSDFNSKVAAFLEKRDVILFDQRGIGQSLPSLNCHEFSDRIVPNEEHPEVMHFVHREDYMPAMLDAAKACAKRLRDSGIELEAYNSNENADDVDDIRRALGIKVWSITGSSYGSRLGLNVIRRHPKSVHAAVLSSVLPPQLDFDTEGRLARLEKSYFSRNPDVEPLLQKLTPLLNQAPITLKTLAIDSYSVKSVPWLFSGDQLSGLLYGALYSPKSVAGFKTLLTNLDQGNLNGLDVEVTQNTVIPVELTNLGFFFAFDCNDTFSHASKAEIQKNIDANPEIGPLMYGRDLAWGAEFIDMCHLFVDPRAATPHFRTPVKSSIPVLFISGEFDPATPPENADLAAKTLSNSQVVVVPGGGHDSMFGGPCPIALTRDFLNSPFQKVDQSCLSAQADAQ